MKSVLDISSILPPVFDFMYAHFHNSFLMYLRWTLAYYTQGNRQGLAICGIADKDVLSPHFLGSRDFYKRS